MLHVEVANDVPDMPDGRQHTDELGVACAVLYEYRSGRFRVFGPGDTGQLRERLFLADWISGHNLLRLDYPLLWGQSWDDFRVGNHFRPLSSRTNDMVRRITLASGMHPDAVGNQHSLWSLDAVGRGTVGRGRAGTGRETPAFHKAGNWPAVVSFGLDACGLVVDLVNFVERYGYVVHAGNGFRLDLRHFGMRSPLPDQINIPPDAPQEFKVAPTE